MLQLSSIAAQKILCETLRAVDTMNLAGTIAVVTGASSGIGEATAHALCAKGSRVVLVARNKARLDKVVSDIRSQGGKADAYEVDLSDSFAIATAVPKIVSAVGVPDILVNNAGAGRWLPIAETTSEDASQMMAVPYLAAFNLTREFLGGMVGRGTGHIVNVTSVASRLVWPGAVAYTAGRWAMEGFTASLRADLHDSGIGVTLAILGTVDSPYWEHNPGSRERLPKRAAGIRPLTPAETAAAIIAGVERGKRTVIKPGVFRLFFLLNALFPRQIETIMCHKV
ncbi:MAG: SDR family oxidoreductase [Verrucomicrobiia bacterium]